MGRRACESRALALAIALTWGATSGAGAHEQEFPEDPGGAPRPVAQAECHGGFAEDFPCRNVDLMAWLPLGEFGGGRANDVWGWTDPETGIEYALLGLEGGMAVVELADPTAPVYLGLLPAAAANSSWRDIKVYADHAFVVSEAAGHGMQVLDLTQLAGVVNPPVTFAATAHYTGFGNAHNVAINEDTGFAYAVGTTGSCNRGLHMVDIADPANPVFAGCFSEDGYTHDAQCVSYSGPDTAHVGHEICLNSNEDTLTIADVTSKSAPTMLSRSGYPGRGYTHQGWLTEDQRYFLVDDESDELSFGHPTRTYVWDVADLDAPALLGFFESGIRATDHNLYIAGEHVFQANYRGGLRVLHSVDLSRVELVEAAYFDTVPGSDTAGYVGAWSVYPFFASEYVVVSDINQGLFVLDPHPDAIHPCIENPTDSDGDGVADVCDNCANRRNADQYDANLDGFGNACDGDLDDDGTVGATDFNRFRATWNACEGEANFDAAADSDGSGCVALEDFGAFRHQALRGLGPSGLACAGTPGCESP